MPADPQLTIEQTGSAVLFAEAVGPLLGADPVLNSHAIGWLDAAVQTEQHIAEQANAALFSTAGAAPALPEHWPPIMQVVRAGEVVVAAAIEGPRPGLTTILAPDAAPETSEAAMELIGSELATVGPHITMLTGPTFAVDGISSGLAAAGGTPFRTTLVMRLYELAEPAELGEIDGWSRAPDPADEADMTLLARWQHEFGHEVGLAWESRPGSIQTARQTLRRSAFLFWCNDSGPVAMAGYGTGENGDVLLASARIAFVYTPPEFRGRQFGKAAAHAACEHARSRGAKRILLFADIDAVAPNRIYQQLGFEPVTEFLMMNRGV